MGCSLYLEKFKSTFAWLLLRGKFHIFHLVSLKYNGNNIFFTALKEFLKQQINPLAAFYWILRYFGWNIRAICFQGFLRIFMLRHKWDHVTFNYWQTVIRTSYFYLQFYITFVSYFITSNFSRLMPRVMSCNELKNFQYCDGPQERARQKQAFISTSIPIKNPRALLFSLDSFHWAALSFSYYWIAIN